MPIGGRIDYGTSGSFKNSALGLLIILSLWMSPPGIQVEAVIRRMVSRSLEGDWVLLAHTLGAPLTYPSTRWRHRHGPGLRPCQ